MFSGEWIEMIIFGISPSFEETKCRGLHGSFDDMFRFLVSLFWITCMTLHTVAQFRGLHVESEYIF
jgi:hypothetical protein